METKVCRVCKEKKELSKFQKKLKKNQEEYRVPTCRRCIYLRWFNANRDRAREIQYNADQNRKKLFQKKREEIFNHINQHCCIRCGNDDKRVLQFHHRDKTTKDIQIGDLGRNLDKLKIEAEKCDVVCANCHIIIHHEIRIKEKGIYE